MLVVNDMGFTNAGGTHTQMSKHAKDEDTLFVWHGGDISYADDWYSGGGTSDSLLRKGMLTVAADVQFCHAT